MLSGTLSAADKVSSPITACPFTYICFSPQALALLLQVFSTVWSIQRGYDDAPLHIRTLCSYVYVFYSCGTLQGHPPIDVILLPTGSRLLMRHRQFLFGRRQPHGML